MFSHFNSFYRVFRLILICSNKARFILNVIMYTYLVESYAFPSTMNSSNEPGRQEKETNTFMQLCTHINFVLITYSHEYTINIYVKCIALFGYNVIKMSTYL